jgi:glutathione S-transferase
MSSPSPSNPPHITLHGFAKPENSPSSSGYCQKLETYLRASGFTNYTHAPTMASSAPKKKLPYITLTLGEGATETLTDSHFIILRLVALGVVRDMDSALTPQLRGESRAWIAWTEELVYPAIVDTRWKREHNYVQMVAGLPVPGMLRGVLGWWLRRHITGALWTAGVGRHSDEDVNTLMREYMDALGVKLEACGGWFFGGEEPSKVDVVVWAFLANALELGHGNSEYTEMVMAREAIKRYVERGCRAWFPEYEDLVAKVTVGEAARK